MDGDLQHPPELITKFIGYMETGLIDNPGANDVTKVFMRANSSEESQYTFLPHSMEYKTWKDLGFLLKIVKPRVMKDGVLTEAEYERIGGLFIEASKANVPVLWSHNSDILTWRKNS